MVCCNLINNLTFHSWQNIRGWKKGKVLSWKRRNVSWKICKLSRDLWWKFSEIRCWVATWHVEACLTTTRSFTNAVYGPIMNFRAMILYTLFKILICFLMIGKEINTFMHNKTLLATFGYSQIKIVDMFHFVPKHFGSQFWRLRAYAVFSVLVPYIREYKATLIIRRLKNCFHVI